uniref:Uncharacterized protein n=1 Tax=Mesocestoides corti TaxID=53468 RepID=A0A5K3G185_MESCO
MPLFFISENQCIGNLTRWFYYHKAHVRINEKGISRSHLHAQFESDVSKMEGTISRFESCHERKGREERDSRLANGYY